MKTRAKSYQIQSSSEDDNYSPTSEDESEVQKPETPPKRKPQAKRRKTEKGVFAMNKEDVLECFEFMDSEGKGILTKEDIQKAALMFDVHLEDDQIEEMMSFALGTTSSDLDINCFQNLIKELSVL